MSIKTILMVLAISAITLSLGLSAVVANQAQAKQTATTTCSQTQSGQSQSGDCPGNSENSPNKEETCKAKNAGQQKKLC
jgi:hypothetical protein